MILLPAVNNPHLIRLVQLLAKYRQETIFFLFEAIFSKCNHRHIIISWSLTSSPHHQGVGRRVSPARRIAALKDRGKRNDILLTRKWGQLIKISWNLILDGCDNARIGTPQDRWGQCIKSELGQHTDSEIPQVQQCCLDRMVPKRHFLV